MGVPQDGFPESTTGGADGTSGADALFGDRVGEIHRYVDILTSRGVDWGLIGPREVPRVWERHILNSVAIVDLIPDGSAVIDVGSGAGLPGLPLALARPDLQITLLEPLLRRSTFLTETVGELGLAGRVTIVRARAEDHPEHYDVVAARALAPLPRLVPWCAPLLRSRGVILALKGRSAEREVADADAALRSAGMTAEVLDVRALPTAEPTSVVRIRR